MKAPNHVPNPVRNDAPNHAPSSIPVASRVERIRITRPDDWHLHLRDGEALQAVLPATASRFGRAVVMPNLQPPITTVAQARDYRERILAARDAAVASARIAGDLSTATAMATFEPLMTLYLTDATAPAEIAAAKASGIVHGVKLYPAGATTHSDAGVRRLSALAPVLEAMQSHALPLLVHGEVTDAEVDVFDREAVFIDRVLEPLRHDFPSLRIVFEHATTREAVQWVQAHGPGLAATITPQHLLYDRNALFRGGLRPHWYCLPVLKRASHRQALLAAATSGDPRFFLGTDSAPHARHLKEHACGCAGCYTAPHAIELYASAFDAVGALDRLEGFAAHYGADFYGLARNRDFVTLARQPQRIADELPFVGGSTLVPLAGGEQLAWSVVAVGAA